MARPRRLVGITAVALVAVAMLAAGSHLRTPVSTVTGPDVVGPGVATRDRLAAIAVDAQPDGWARSEHRRHSGFANRFFLGLLGGMAAVTIVLLAAGAVARDRRDRLRRPWRAGHIRLRAPPHTANA